MMDGKFFVFSSVLTNVEKKKSAADDVFYLSSFVK